MLNFYDFGGEDFPSLYLIYDTNLLQFIRLVYERMVELMVLT